MEIKNAIALYVELKEEITDFGEIMLKLINKDQKELALDYFKNINHLRDIILSPYSSISTLERDELIKLCDYYTKQYPLISSNLNVAKPQRINFW